MMVTGRPTKYKQEYCDMLIDHMAQGLSFTSFAGLIEVNPDTLHEWVKVHPEFSESKKIGRAKSLLLWERIGVQGTTGAGKSVKKFNAAAWIFNMKNKHGYTDKQEHTIEAGSKNSFTLNYNLDKTE